LTAGGSHTRVYTSEKALLRSCLSYLKYLYRTVIKKRV